MRRKRSSSVWLQLLFIHPENESFPPILESFPVQDYKVIGTLNPGNAVLFLGSGFSLESTNIAGAAPPNGANLRKHFIDKLGLPSDTSYDLQILTDEFANHDGELLSKELYRIFRISTPGESQTQILSHSWLRVYTTNYDDTVEICHHKRGLQPRSYDAQDQLPNKLPKNSIIHLHGSIRNVTAENALNGIVLGEKSYVRQQISKSPWYNQLQIDMRFASNVFIVGYSMADYHISALLLQNPELAEKTFFIQGSTIDDVFVRRTKPYGRPLFIGLAGFAEAIRELPRPEAISDVSQLRSLRLLDPQRDRKAQRPPTANEVFELVVFGAFNYMRCVSSLPEETYVISRKAEIENLLKALETNRSVIVDSRLGNGKTIFLHLSFIELAQRGYNCFLFKEPGPEIEAEISLLKQIPRVVILFDQYTAAQDIIARLASELPDAKFLIEVRTSIFEVRYHEVSQNAPKPFTRVSVNQLSKRDTEAFYELCSRSGLVASHGRSPTNSTEFREILLQIFDSDNIKSKVTATLKPIFERAPRRKVLLLTTLLSNFGITSDPSFIKSVTGVDPYQEFIEIKDVSDELFEITIDTFRIRSAVFSDFAVSNFIPPEEILDCVVEAALAAATRKDERRYRVLMSNLMQYSNISRLLRNSQSANKLIAETYERLRYDQRINDEPLFWLQYAISMVEDENLAAATEFIATAYSRAEGRAGFQTYQIDTQAFRISLLTATRAPAGSPVANLSSLLEQLDLINGMLKEESHRTYAIRVLEGLYPFISNRISDLAVSEKTSLTFWINVLSDTLKELPMDFRARSGSDQTHAILQQAKTLLLK